MCLHIGLLADGGSRYFLLCVSFSPQGENDTQSLNASLAELKFDCCSEKSYGPFCGTIVLTTSLTSTFSPGLRPLAISTDSLLLRPIVTGRLSLAGVCVARSNRAFLGDQHEALAVFRLHRAAWHQHDAFLMLRDDLSGVRSCPAAQLDRSP